MNDSAAVDGLPRRGLPLRNFGLSLTSKLGSLGAHIVFMMMTARMFSKEEIAVIAFTGIITILMEVCKGLGTGTLMMKRLPQLGESARDESRILIVTFLFYSLVPPLALTLAGLALPIGNLLKLSLLTSLFTVLSNTNIVVLQASQKFAPMAAMTMITSTLQRLAPCVAAMWFGTGLERFLVWCAAATAIGFAASCLPLAPLLRPWRFELLAWRQFWPECRHFFGSSLLRYGATQVDQLFVAVLFPPATLAVYYMLRRLYSLSVVLIQSMIDAMVPELAQQAGTDARGARKRLTEWSRLALFAGSAGAALMAGNGSAVIELLLGPGYGDDSLLITLFAATTSLYFLYCFVQVDLLLFQAPERVFRMAAATAAANLLAGPLTSRWLGVHSLPLAMLSGYLLGLVAARWSVGGEPAPRPVWRLRELGAGLVVVTLSSLAALAAQLAPLRDWERVAAVNLVITALVAAHFWRNRVGDSLRRLGHRTV